MKTSKTVAIVALAMIGLVALASHAAGIDLAAWLSPDLALSLSLVGAAGITNFQQEGETITLTPTAAVNSGQGYLFGVSLFGVATNYVAANAAGEFLTEGVVSIAKTSALAIAVGDRVFWDATNKVVNKTNTSQQCVGVAIEAAVNPSAVVAIKLGAVTAVAA